MITNIPRMQTKNWILKKSYAGPNATSHIKHGAKLSNGNRPAHKFTCMQHTTPQHWHTHGVQGSYQIWWDTKIVEYRIVLRIKLTHTRVKRNG